jgi:hypothetical protein
LTSSENFETFWKKFAASETGAQMELIDARNVYKTSPGWYNRRQAGIKGLKAAARKQKQRTPECKYVH